MYLNHTAKQCFFVKRFLSFHVLKKIILSLELPYPCYWPIAPIIDILSIHVYFIQVKC